MRHRVDLLVSVVFVPVLAAAMLLGAARVASAAEGCIEKPGAEVDGGHWYYRVDRQHHRRCWFLGSEGAVTAASNTDEVPWFYRFAAGLVGVSFAPKQNSVTGISADTSKNNMSASSPEPTQNAMSNSGSKTASPKGSLTRKIARQDQSQSAPPPMTTGLASTQTGQLQNPAEENERQARPLSDADRRLLFQEFLKWYRDRGVYGQP